MLGQGGRGSLVRTVSNIGGERKNSIMKTKEASPKTSSQCSPVTELLSGMKLGKNPFGNLKVISAGTRRWNL